MQKFHGDLLMGGVAIRDLDGTLEDEPQSGASFPCGRFSVEAEKEELFELGRPYLLMLDDGRCSRVVVTEMHEENDQGSFVCQFRVTWQNEQSG